MDAKTTFRFAAYAATVLLLSACIYPYTVEIQRGTDYPLVVEGDIQVGGTTVVKLSYVRPFNQDGFEYVPVSATGYVEGEDGIRIDGTPVVDMDWNPRSPTKLSFDTSRLQENQRYRLHINTHTESGALSNEFESEWLSPCPAPVIDGLSYSRNDQFEELWIGLSMHCNGSHHFRWTFTETWEYHSDIRSTIAYIPTDVWWDEVENRYYDVGGYYTQDYPGYYYCWKNYASPSINIFSTANQTEDRFEDLSFHTIALNDKRLQSLYRINVQLFALSESAYNYWNNIKQNSSGQGSIFAPTPSEMASNVLCITDPSVQVMGYLNAAVPAKAVMYYDNAVEQFYKPGLPYERGDTTIARTNTSAADYLLRRGGYLPYRELYNDFSPIPSDYTWAFSNCIDCREEGGTKNRPLDWPNNGHL